MILDELTEFADANTIGVQGATGSELLGDVIDLGTARDVGNGQPLYLVITVEAEIDSAADGASVEFVLVSDAQEAIATNGTASEHVSTGVIGEADLPAGRTFVLALPTEGVPYERYLGVIVRRTGEAVTGGSVNAGLAMDPHGNRVYPNSPGVGPV